MLKSIPFSGLTAATSDYVAPDGELTVALNLVPENSSLQPVLPPAVVRDDIPDGLSLVFIHQSPAGRRFLIFHNPTARTLFAADATASLTADIPSTPFYTLPADTELLSFASIGNTLCILTSDGIIYAVIHDNSYRVIGSHLPDIRLYPLLSGHDHVGSGDTLSFPDTQNFQFPDTEFTNDNRKYANEKLSGWINKFISDAHENSHFVQPFFIRFALRLYDGSLAMHTAPVLIRPVIGQNPVIEFNPTNMTAVTRGILADLCINPLDPQFASDIQAWADIVKSIDIFISEPIYTYDQNGDFMHRVDSFSAPTTSFSTVHPDQQASQAASLGSSETNLIAFSTFFGHSAQQRTIALPHPDFKDFADTVRDNANFYLLHSIPLEKVSELGSMGTYTPLDIPKGTLPSIRSRERMTDDFNSHDRIIPRFAFNYNSRLNIANIIRRTPAVIDSVVNYNTVDFAATAASGEMYYPRVTPYVYFSFDGTTSVVRGRTFTMPTAAQLPFIYHPDREATRIVLVRKKSYNATADWISFDLKPHDFLNGAAYVADADSFSLKSQPVWRTDALPYGEQAFQPADSGEQAFQPADSQSATDQPSYATRHQPTRIYSSQVNNPFFFPVTGMNAVGSGEILGISAAAKALSQGQFGQFPLYAFCSDGVWALSVASDGKFTAVQPITRDVCINPDAITQIDSAVIFPSARGVMLLSGSEATCISDAVRNTSSIVLGQFMSVAHMINPDIPAIYDILPFTLFLARARFIYDYPHQRLIFYQPHGQQAFQPAPLQPADSDGDTIPYAYVYSLRSGRWGMMLAAVAYNVASYPDALAVDARGRLVDFSIDPADPDAVPAVLLTRPLKLDNPDILKRVRGVITRGCFSAGDLQSVLYGSRDLRLWSPIWSSADHRLRGFGGSPYKYFRLLLVAALRPDASVSSASFDFDPALTNHLR